MPFFPCQQTEWFNILTAIPRNSDLAQTRRVILQKLCEAIHWDYGEIWMVQEDPTLLCLSPTWYLSPSIGEGNSHQSWQQFRACSLEFTLHLGEGLPGRVYASQQPEWVSDVSTQSEGYFLRNKIAKAFSVRAGLGVPILVKQKVTAVFVFFKAKSCPEDLAIMEWLQTMLGQVEPLFLPTGDGSI